MTGSREKMEEFWDGRAREDAYFFVDDRVEYGAGASDAFWAGGVDALDRVLGTLQAEIDPGDDVVEIGCGVGRMTRPLAARARAVTAVDISAEMLAIARRENERLPNVTWLQGDGIDLAGVAPASADACLSFVVFQHVPDPRITLGYVREMGRVLRAGGWSAFQISNAPEIHRPAEGEGGIRRRLARAAGRAPRGRDHPAWIGSPVDLAQLRAVAGESGLTLERVVGEGSQFCLVLLRRS